MTKRHILLIIGIFLTFISFLFFGRKTDTHNILFLLGILVCLFAYSSLLFSKNHFKDKIKWTVIMVGMLFINHFISPYLIRCSYLIYAKKHLPELVQISRVLKDKEGEIRIFKDSIYSEVNTFSHADTERLKKFVFATESYMIEKTEDFIRVRLWGFLDVRHDVYYPLTKDENFSLSRSIGSNWFY